MAERRVFDGKIHLSVTAFFVVYGADKRGFYGLGIEFFKLEHPAPRHYRGRHRRVRVFGGRTDKNNRAAFYRGEKTVRLRFTETMTFVEQKIGLLAVYS